MFLILLEDKDFSLTTFFLGIAAFTVTIPKYLDVDYHSSQEHFISLLNSISWLFKTCRNDSLLVMFMFIPPSALGSLHKITEYDDEPSRANNSFKEVVKVHRDLEEF